METNQQTVKLTRTIQASPQEVFDSFQYECRLREWMCDGARTVPRKGGLFDVWWNSGYEARGVFTLYLPPRTLAFTWLGTGEPGETHIRVTLKPVEGGTRVTLTHFGFGTGKKWAGRAEESERQWSGGLDNLKSVLETGIDLRQMNQPRIGLGFETFEDNKGALLTAIVSGSPAELAGLQKGDVIVRMGNSKVRGQEEFIAVFSTCRAGQRVKVAYLREGKRHTTTVELAARPVPEISGDPVIVVEQARQVHEQALNALWTSVALLTDEQAELAPAEGEWSIKQALAHLIVCEPEYRAWAVRVLLGDNPEYWVEARLPEQFATVLSARPTVRALVERLESELAASRAFVGALTPEHLANKVRYRLVAMHLVDLAHHVNLHLEQIQATAQHIKSPIPHT